MDFSDPFSNIGTTPHLENGKRKNGMRKIGKREIHQLSSLELKNKTGTKSTGMRRSDGQTSSASDKKVKLELKKLFEL